MPRRWLKRVLPDVEKYRDSKVARLLGPRFFHPALWHLHRRSVAGGVAIGLFCGLIPGPLQMLGGALCAVWLKRNLPVALVTTLYTNPLTIIPLYLLAYQLGALVIGPSADAVPAPSLSGMSPTQWADALGAWSLSLGKPLLVGVPLLAALLALIGYVVVNVGWGLYLRWAWAQRKRARRRN
jgi:uncharacterized protein (DUF2062 family)